MTSEQREHQILDYYMDFREIKFVSTENETKEGIVGDSQKEYIHPKIYYYTPDDVAFKMPFFLTIAGHFCVGPQFFTKREKLQSYQCILTVNGSCTMEIECQPPFECTKNTVLILDCYKKHFYYTGADRTWEYKHFHFSAPTNKFLVEKTEGLINITGNIESYIDDIFKAIDHMETTCAYQISDYISRILTEIVVLKQQQPIFNIHTNQLENAARYLREHFSENINIYDVAQEQFMSRYYFIRLFKEYYGVSPYAYLVNHRVKKAKEMLFMNASVAEIARTCGFGNSNNFNRIFKQYTGKTPTAFKKQGGSICT